MSVGWHPGSPFLFRPCRGNAAVGPGGCAGTRTGRKLPATMPSVGPNVKEKFAPAASEVDGGTHLRQQPGGARVPGGMPL